MACRPAIPSRSGLATAGRGAVTCRSASPGSAVESLSTAAWRALSPGAVAWFALLCAQPLQLARTKRMEPVDRLDQQGHLGPSMAQTPTGQCRVALVALQYAAGRASTALWRPIAAHPVGRCHPHLLSRPASRHLALALCLRPALGTIGLGAHQHPAGG